MPKKQMPEYVYMKAARSLRVIQNVVALIYLHQKIDGVKLVYILPKLPDAIITLQNAFNRYSLPNNDVLKMEFDTFTDPNGEWREAMQQVSDLAEAYLEVKTSIPELSKLHGKQEQEWVKTWGEMVLEAIDDIMLKS
jgi:hypothetical protein